MDGFTEEDGTDGWFYGRGTFTVWMITGTQLDELVWDFALAFGYWYW